MTGGIAKVGNQISGFLGNVFGANKSGTTTTINEKQKKSGETEIVVNTTSFGDSRTVSGLDLAGYSAHRPLPTGMSDGAGKTSKTSTAPRTAVLRGTTPGQGPIPNSTANAHQVQEGGLALVNSANASGEMFAQIQQAAFMQMKFQADNAQLQSLTKMSESHAKQIKSIGEGIKSTGAQ